MLLIRNISLPYTVSESQLPDEAARKCRIEKENIRQIKIVSKSLDARKKTDIRYLYSVVVSFDETTEKKIMSRRNQDVVFYSAAQPVVLVPGNKELKGRVVVVGLGPAGLFAAYVLAKAGYRPFVLERGKKVEQRTKDVQELWEKGVLSYDSNPMFGEGGAGTFSDGKLTSRSKDFRGAEVMRILIENGAPEEIAWLAKPHLGTDKLKNIVSNLRKKIEELGGEIHFSARLTDISTESGHLKEISFRENGKEQRIPCDACVLAVGLGARDTWRMLNNKHVYMEAKPFAVGLRIEHPQKMINDSQFGPEADIGILGSAEYKLTCEQNGRGVYSFCMCPGGYVVNTSSEAGMISVNGMSYSDRSAENANSALIVQVRPEDFGNTPIGGIEYCENIEKNAFALSGSEKHIAPASRLEDFLQKRKSGLFGSVQPTVRPYPVLANLWECLPVEIAEALAGSFQSFGRKIRGFDLPDAVLTAPETRSSAPLRIVRNENGESVSMVGLYPCGEGAGYAGGIVSAAIDGMHQAERIVFAFKVPEIE